MTTPVPAAAKKSKAPLIIFLVVVGVLGFCMLSGLGLAGLAWMRTKAADSPTENQGANAMDARIREESNGLLRLVKFTKTDGQKANVNGIPVYTMNCSVETIAVQDCAMTGFGVTGNWDGSFGAMKAQKNAGGMEQFNPFSGAYAGHKQLAKNQKLTFTVTLHFDLTERGWRTGGRLPEDKPFVVDLNRDLAAVPVAQIQALQAAGLPAFAGVRFGDRIELKALALEETADGRIVVRMLWSSLREQHRDLIVAVHLMDAKGEVFANLDHPHDLEQHRALAGTMWISEAVIGGEHRQRLDHLGIGLYSKATGLLRSDRGPSDWDGRRLLVPVPATRER